MSHTSKAADSPEQVPELKSTPVYVGKFFPTDNEFEFIPTSGSRLGAQVVEAGWNHLPTTQQLALPVPAGIEDGMEVAASADLLTDHTGEVQRLKKLESGISRSGPEISQQICDFVAELEDPVSDSEFCESKTRDQARRFVEQAPNLRSAINPEATAVELAQSIGTLQRLAIQFQPAMENQQLVQLTRDHMIAQQTAKDDEARSLADEIEPHVTAINGLRAVTELAGDGRIPGWIVNVRDHHQLFGEGLSRFIKSLRGRKQPFYDIVVLDAFYGETAFLRGAGEQLEKSLQCSVWASIATGDEAETIAYASTNPTAASTGAGSVFAFVGDAAYRGYPVVPSAAVFGNRLRLDLSPQGQLVSHWGPQANKALSQVSADTLEWDEDTLVAIAQQAGLNALWKYNNQNVSPYVGRTLSSLPDYRMTDEGRTASMLEGFATEYLSLNAISEPAAACVVRAQCERAEHIYIEPFRLTHRGFEGRIDPAGIEGSKARIDIIIAARDPIEELIVTRRGGRAILAT